MMLRFRCVPLFKPQASLFRAQMGSYSTNHGDHKLVFRQLFEKESSTYTYLLADASHPQNPALVNLNLITPSLSLVPYTESVGVGGYGFKPWNSLFLQKCRIAGDPTFYEYLVFDLISLHILFSYFDLILVCTVWLWCNEGCN